MKSLVVYLKALVAVGSIAFAMSLTSCQKELPLEILDSLPQVVDTLPHNVSNLVKTYTETVTTSALNYSENFTLVYDASNRVTSLVSNSIPGNKFLYQYGSDNTYTMDIYVGNALSIHEKFFLTSFALVDSSIQSNDTGDTTTEKYTYNPAHQLVKLETFSYTVAGGAVLQSTTTYTYDASGNTSIETSGSTVTTYTYYPTLANTLNLGQFYFYQNLNLTKTTTITSGSTSQSLDHTYTFDNLGRQVTEKITDADGNIVIRSYTYY